MDSNASGGMNAEKELDAKQFYLLCAKCTGKDNIVHAVERSGTMQLRANDSMRHVRDVGARYVRRTVRILKNEAKRSRKEKRKRFRILSCVRGWKD